VIGKYLSRAQIRAFHIPIPDDCDCEDFWEIEAFTEPSIFVSRLADWHAQGRAVV